MYGNSHGRFTSPDPLLSSGHPQGPQTWNRYALNLNNPIVYVDPTGLYVCKAGKSECEQFDAALENARNRLPKIEEKYGGKDSKQYKKAERAVNSYGAKGVDNGVFIFSRDGTGSGRVATNGYAVPKTKDNPTGQRIMVAFDPAVFSHTNFDNLISHEGSHVADGSDWVASGFSDASNPTNYQTEFDGLYVQALMAEAKGVEYSEINTTFQLPFKPYRNLTLPTQIWNSSWAPADVETRRTNNIRTHLELDNMYKLKPDDKTKAFDRRARFR